MRRRALPVRTRAICSPSPNEARNAAPAAGSEERTFAATATRLLSWLGSSSTNLQETSPLVWVLLGLSVAGAIITFAFLVYAVWKWRDPVANRRRYG
jgi:hypothetical protein